VFMETRTDAKTLREQIAHAEVDPVWWTTNEEVILGLDPPT
jgi:hypothetical protein